MGTGLHMLNLTSLRISMPCRRKDGLAEKLCVSA